jgi:hypothetical protein
MKTINTVKETVCAEHILTNYKYDPDTGIITKNNVPVGWKHPKGYYQLTFKLNKKLYTFKYHRIAWFLHYGVFPKSLIDHADGDATNNKINNLRDCSNSENLCNRSKQKNNKSGYKNVFWWQRDNKWCVRVMKNGLTYFGGYFIKLEDAIVVADKLRKELHNNFTHE